MRLIFLFVYLLFYPTYIYIYLLFYATYISIYPTETLSLHDEVLHKAQAWFGSIPGLPRQRILSSFGAFPLLEPQADSLAVPAGGPAWQWWLIAVLPLDPRAQLAILAMCSIKDRLLALRRVINFITQPRST